MYHIGNNHLSDQKLQTAKASSIRNRQVSWLVTVLITLPIHIRTVDMLNENLVCYLQLRDSS